MLNRSPRLLLVACLVTSTLWAANDPFVGDWKLNPSKSKLTDEMKVEKIGANKYAFDFEGSPPILGHHGWLHGSCDYPGLRRRVCLGQ